MSNRSAFKQDLRGFVKKGAIKKANSDDASEIIINWRDVLNCKQTTEECAWDEINASLFNMKSAMKKSGIPQTDIDIVQNIMREVKDARTKLQNLYISEGSRIDELEALWGLEAGALE